VKAPKKKGKGHRARPLPGNPNDPDGLHVWTSRFLKALQVKNMSRDTVTTRRLSISQFIEWADTRSITKPTQVTKPVIEAFQRFLYNRRLPSGKPLSWAAQSSTLVGIKSFFRWLTRSNVLLYNPASEIELPRVGRRVPRHVLTVAEVEAVISQADVKEPLGLRDRAMMEVLYSTGMRRSELVSLAIFDLDWERGTILVRDGKGGQDRIIPIGERAMSWVDRYSRQARMDLLTDPNDTTLFISRLGGALAPGQLGNIVGDYVKAAKIGKTGSCHLFRHAMATLMLEGGADVRMIQAMLGHASLDTTAIYTNVAIRKLKAIHEQTHPGAMLGRKKAEKSETDQAASKDAKAALSASLDEETGDEGDP
jgi:integrase/recombinase XerD